MLLDHLPLLIGILALVSQLFYCGGCGGCERGLHCNLSKNMGHVEAKYQVKAREQSGSVNVAQVTAQS